MEQVIVTTPAELRSLINDAVKSCMRPESKTIPVSDNLTMEGAIAFLQENGYPTSKAKLYKLTSSNKMPYKKYGIKLVFSRKELLEWANSQTIKFGK